MKNLVLIIGLIGFIGIGSLEATRISPIGQSQSADVFLSAVMACSGLSSKSRIKTEINAFYNELPPDIKSYIRDHREIGKNNYLMGILLRAAVRRNCVNIVRYLLSVLKNLSVLDSILDDGLNAGGTLLHSAVACNQIEVVREMINRGVNVDLLDVDAHTPLYYAAIAGRFEMAQLLLQNGAYVGETYCASDNDVRFRDAERLPDEDRHFCNGQTLLHFAVSNKDIKMASLLIHHGIDVNKGGVYDFTPLHFAVLNGDEEMVKLLLDCPAIDVNVVDVRGRTPLDIACDSNLVDLLVAKGAKKGANSAVAPVTQSGCSLI